VGTARVDGIAIDYSDTGTGRGLPIVCLTGWCSDRNRYANFVPQAARSRRVVTIDWRGHGGSGASPADFGTRELADDVLAVVDAADLDEFCLVSASHSGWVAIEACGRVPERIPRVLHFDWLVTEPSDRYLAVIEGLQSEATWESARDTLFDIWRGGIEDPDVEAAIAAMARHGAEMWMRSGREIEAAFREHGSPLAAWSRAESRPRILHLYGQPQDPAYFARQQSFAADNDWFSVHHLPARSHFTMIESPIEAVAVLDEFLR